MSRPDRQKPLPPASGLAPGQEPGAGMSRRSGWRLGRVWGIVEPLSVALIYIFMLSQSWLRWMDPLIDFPRDLYMAWRLSEGDLLYGKLANYYGPLAQLMEAAGFRIFGVGLDTMIWMNITLTALIILGARTIFGALGNRLSVWVGSVTFLGVFAFGHYGTVANANFTAPYVAQTTYGFAGLLLLLWGVLRHLKTERPLWLGVAGLGWAVAYLDKPEPLLAGSGALGLYFLAQFVRRAQMKETEAKGQSPRQWAAESAIWLVGGFGVLWLAVFLFFLRQGGVAYAWLATNYVPHTMASSAFQQVVLNSGFMRQMLGFDHPWTNFVNQLTAGALLTLVCGLLAWATRQWARAAGGSTAQWAWGGTAVGVGLIGASLGIRANYWEGTGVAVVFPVYAAAAIYAWCSLRAAWQGREEASRLLGVAVVGVAAALMLARMILFGRFSQFGFFMMPLAVLWLLHVMIVEVARPAAGQLRANILLPAVFSVVVLSGALILMRYNLSAYRQKNFVVGEGRDHFYAFDPMSDPSGWLVEEMLASFRQRAPTAKSLVVFPEGIEANYLLRVPTPLAELEFQPVALGYAGPSHVLAELQAHPPEVIFLTHRDLTEFGANYFGEDEKSGRTIVEWIAQNYQLAGYIGSSAKTYSGHALDMLVPKNASRPGPPLEPAPGH